MTSLDPPPAGDLQDIETRVELVTEEVTATMTEEDTVRTIEVGLEERIREVSAETEVITRVVVRIAVLGKKEEEVPTRTVITLETTDTASIRSWIEFSL